MKQILRSLLVLAVLSFSSLISFSQVQSGKILSGSEAEDNLVHILNVSPTMTGTLGFDNRFEGVKGSPRLFASLLPSFLKIIGHDEYYKLNTDLDIYRNRLMFKHPTSGKLLYIPANLVKEVIIKTDSSEKVFRTTASIKFEKELKEVRFFEVLKDGPRQFIKMPLKKFVEADFKNAYSPDRRYDEFETSYKYYVMTNDSIFHPIQLNKKSLIKLFPDKKKLIESVAVSSTFKNDEEMILYVLGKFQAQ